MPSARHISEPMAGSPLKRQRKLGIRAEDGSIIAFPRMPRVSALPPGWRHWSPAEKIEHLLGMSLDRCYEILSWPMTDLDPFRFSVWVQVWRVVFTIGIKAYLDRSLDRAAGRERDRQGVLEELARRLDANLHYFVENMMQSSLITTRSATRWRVCAERHSAASHNYTTSIFTLSETRYARWSRSRLRSSRPTRLPSNRLLPATICPSFACGSAYTIGRRSSKYRRMTKHAAAAEKCLSV